MREAIIYPTQVYTQVQGGEFANMTCPICGDNFRLSLSNNAESITIECIEGVHLFAGAMPNVDNIFSLRRATPLESLSSRLNQENNRV